MTGYPIEAANLRASAGELIESSVPGSTGTPAEVS